MSTHLTYQTKRIAASSVDGLVRSGIHFIQKTGTRLHARAGDGLQVYNIEYVLTNPLRRVHTLRAPASIQYFAKELTVYLSGTLSAQRMARATPFWLKVQDDEGNIHSNYGHYVFHQTGVDGLTQYERVVRLLATRPQTRRAIIFISQPNHNDIETKDLPCTVALQFFIQTGHLCCVAQVRSTDVVTGLPYDMGFFSFVQELVAQDLRERGRTSLKLGYCVMKSTFSQLYDSRVSLAKKAQAHQGRKQSDQMPPITDAQAVIRDITHNTTLSAPVQWAVQTGGIPLEK